MRAIFTSSGGPEGTGRHSASFRSEPWEPKGFILLKIAAGVDLISRGRLTLGIGAGYFETEYRQYGWEFPARPAVRIRQMEEAVRLILALWLERRTTPTAGISMSSMRSSSRSRSRS